MTGTQRLPPHSRNTPQLLQFQLTHLIFMKGQAIHACAPSARPECWLPLVLLAARILYR